MKDEDEKFHWWYIAIIIGSIVGIVWLERLPEPGEAPPPSLRSYWPTTIRVATNMDSFWLPDEERTCQTYPSSNGTVASVVCNPLGTRLNPAVLHLNHNIPVTFWGDLDRNTISDWNCRREGDKFVCRAVD